MQIMKIKLLKFLKYYLEIMKLKGDFTAKLKHLGIKFAP